MDVPPPAAPSRLLRLAVPALMLAVAAHHLHLVRARRRSPWPGGGFGMYSGFTTPWTRVWTCEGIDADGRPCVVLLPFHARSGPLSRSALERLRTMPDDAACGRVADAVFASDLEPAAARQWGAPPDPSGAPAPLRPLTADGATATADGRPVYRIRSGSAAGGSAAVRLRALRFRMLGPARR